MLNRQMKRVADVLARRHHVNQLVGNILRMGGHKADSLNPHLVQRRKKLCKAQFAFNVKPVGVDVLPKQHDFLHAVRLQFARFLDDACRRAGAFPAAHIRNDAIRAEVVAAVHDGDVSVIRAATAHRQIFRNAALVILNHLDHAAAGLHRLEHQLRKTIQIMRAEGQIHKRILLENLFAHPRLLHHAAANADHQLRTCLFQFLEPDHVAQRAPLRIVADAAGVEDDKIRLFSVGGGRHPHLSQHAFQLFTVVRVHLAAVGHHTIGVRAIFQRGECRHPFLLLCNLLFRELDSLRSFHA